MSQAENVPTTSRRSFMRSAAAASAVLPASAGTALALTAGSEIEEPRALEAEISQAWEHLGSVLDIFEQAEKRLAVWKEQNPKPVVRECKLYSQDEAERATPASAAPASFTCLWLMPTTRQLGGSMRKP